MEKWYSKRFPINKNPEAQGGQEHIAALDMAHYYKAGLSDPDQPVDPHLVDRFLFLCRSLAETEMLDIDIFREEGWIRSKFYAPEMLLSREGKDMLSELLRMAEDAVLLTDRNEDIAVTLYFRTLRDPMYDQKEEQAPD